jgi:hypothetical protein
MMPHGEVRRADRWRRMFLPAFCWILPSPVAGVVSKLHLAGAHITARLLLRDATIDVPFVLDNCRFDEPVELDNARLRAADFTGSQLPAIQADGLTVDGDLTLDQVVTSKASLFKAEIKGNLWLTSAQVGRVQTGYASTVRSSEPRVWTGWGWYGRSSPSYHAAIMSPGQT